MERENISVDIITVHGHEHVVVINGMAFELDPGMFDPTIHKIEWVAGQGVIYWEDGRENTLFGKDGYDVHIAPLVRAFGEEQRRVEDNVIIDRMSGRRVCEKCGASYHIINKKSKVEGVCDLCGGKTVIRKDDQPATVLDRLKAYHEQTEPLVAFYRERGKLAVIPFCPSIEETTAEVMKALEA